ncbi:MAG TPA: alpha/beta fold hydrolase [Acidimicrobiia bacterium]|jgi:2-succinyl-6-hydroxy-2,4-cyclohexadiene-1-carboxylate synthase
MRVIVDDGVGLEVEVRGEGPGLLLVHGFGGAKEDFADHVEELAATHRVVVFDHRGHGASDGPEDPDGYTFERYAADTVAVANAAGLGRFRLLGHSMGGMVAQRVVRSDPRRVEALVLMDTSPGTPPALDPDLLDSAAKIALEDGKDVLKTLLDAASTLDSPAHQRLLTERPGFREFEERKWDDLSVAMWAGSIRRIARQESQLDALRALTCPTLILVGEQDGAFLEPSRAMAATVPGAELVVIPDAGHSPQFENPDAWISALTGFLERVDAAGDAASSAGAAS